MAEIVVATEPAEFVTSPVKAGITVAGKVPEFTSEPTMLLLVRFCVSDVPTILPEAGKVCVVLETLKVPVKLLVPVQVLLPPTVTKAPQSASSVPTRLFQHAASLTTVVLGPITPDVENGKL